MNKIQVRDAQANNLQHVSVDIPLQKLVVIVGKSGSGKSSFVYDVLFKASQGQAVRAKVSKLPKTLVLAQSVELLAYKSFGETKLARLTKALKEIKKSELLIVDEPCAGMAREDRQLVLNLLKKTVKKGVSVIVVEHSKDIIIGADYVIEFGPESGSGGGEVIFQGPRDKFKKAKTPTSLYAFSNKASVVQYDRDANKKALCMKNKRLTIKGITKNNLKDVSISFPLCGLVCITGSIGSGKTTLLSVIYSVLFKGKNAWKIRAGAKVKSIDGKVNVRRSYFVDQSSLSPISTSTPATYLGIWDSIRDTYAKLPQSKKLKLTKSSFLINKIISQSAKDKIEKVSYAGKSIFDVSNMTVDDAVKLFDAVPLVKRKLSFLQEVGLGYLALSQRSNTLSGGEAQRVRLAKILSKKLGDRCVYILDVPSRGLHLSDLPVLMKVLQKIIDKNNTVVIAENREEIIQNCDYVIAL
ncbi:MAG: ATP-binding cassette domain-containing protein [Patescibacteria group bacterium]